MKLRFVNGKAVKTFFKNSDKQISKDVLTSIDNVVHCVLSKALYATKNFKRVTETEVNLVCASFIK